MAALNDHLKLIHLFISLSTPPSSFAFDRRLRKVRLDRCRRVTDSGILRLAQECVDLRELSVVFCWVTDSGVAAAVATRPRLRVIDCAGAGIRVDVPTLMCP